MKTINPASIVKPASKYAQAVTLTTAKRRLVISGQVGMRPDGTMEPTTRAQMERAWSNLMAVVADAGFERTHIVKITCFVTEPGMVTAYRETRDAAMQGHLCAATYLQVVALASPDMKVEIEAEAVME